MAKKARSKPKTTAPPTSKPAPKLLTTPLAPPLAAPLAVCLGIAILIWFLFTRLAFTPVPWADGSAFYLPAKDLVSWPPQWRMHAQAAFVPSYDVANFNLMPALPLVLGIAAQLGVMKVLGTALGLKAISLLALLAWAWCLWQWSQTQLSRVATRKAAIWISLAIVLAGLFDPVLRWGTLVVRTETWVGLAWMLVLAELSKIGWNEARNEDGKASPAQLWKIAAGLAVAAYFHFEAIILVPATIVGLWPFQSSKPAEWLRRLLGVGWRTVVLLSPWILYILLNFDLFREQMEVQFHRLDTGQNTWISNAYMTFHSLFISLGSPVSWPKFFNVAKGIFWLLIVILVNRTTYPVVMRLFKAPGSRLPESSPTLGPMLSAGMAFGASLYLWFTKPEVWFTTLCHLTLWPWLGAVIIHEVNHRRARTRAGLQPKYSDPKSHPLRTTLASLAAVFAVFAFLATIDQHRKIPAQYSWSTYSTWVDCVARTLQLGGPKPALKVWQPHIPDVLVELADRDPRMDLTRALDFNTRIPLAWQLTKRLDAMIYSRHFPVPLVNGKIPVYEGPERAEDREHLKNGIEVPFGHWFLDRIPAQQAGQWKLQVCQTGPFWAGIALRVAPHVVQTEQ